MWLTTLLATAMSFLPAYGASSTCLTNYGKTACGYRCLAAHGDVACAATPLGVCKATSDAPATQGAGVVCWDPPDAVRAHYGDRAPLPDCIMRRGDLTCGYHCQGIGSEAECATTPDGVCRATSRGVTCWDPPSSTYCPDDRPLPRPQCIVSDAYVACGYNCEARNGQMACAVTPVGRCTMSYGQYVCNDPAPPAMCGGRPCNYSSAQPWCAPPESTDPQKNNTNNRGASTSRR